MINNAPELYHSQYYADFKDAFSIEYKESPGTLNPTYHMHDQYELLLCLSDNMFCEIGRKRDPVGTDTLLLFNSTDLHLFGSETPGGENKRYVAYFEPSYVDYLSIRGVNLLDCFLFRPFERGYLVKLTPDQSAELQEKMDAIIKLKDVPASECYGKDLRLQLMLAELLLTVNTIYRDYHGINASTDMENHQLVYDVISYIHDNFADDLSLDLLAKHFFINKFSLCEKFKGVAGITPNQYIINFRVQKAKELLVCGESVERVCAQAGFNNLSHFSRIFKSKVGQSPKQYQKNSRG